jgi:hypothetical protein
MLQNFDRQSNRFLTEVDVGVNAILKPRLEKVKFFWLVRDGFQFRAFVNTLIDVRVPKNTELCFVVNKYLKVPSDTILLQCS